MTMKYIYRFAITVCFLLLATTISVVHAQSDYIEAPYIVGENIRNFNVKMKVGLDGTVDVTERIEYDFDTLYKHGIYRDIPYLKTNNDGKKYRVDFTDISVTDEAGKAYTFKKQKDNGNLRLKIGDPDKTISGVHEYTIHYVARGALTYFSEHDELYWNVTGNNWTIPVASATAVVELPKEIQQNTLKTACYTGPYGSDAQDCTGIANDHEMSFYTVRPLDGGEGFSIVAGFQNGVVARLEPKEEIPFFQTLLGKLTLAGIMLAALAWYILYPIWLAFDWYRNGRDPKVNGPVSAWYDPPKTASGRPLTPAETGTLIDESVDLRDIQASVVDLARRGFFTIVEVKKNEFELRKSAKPQSKEKLTNFEQKILDIFFGSKDVFNLKNAHIADKIDTAKKLIYDDMVRENFFPRSPLDIRNFYVIITALAGMTFNLPLLFSALIFGRSMPKKTMYGAEQASVAKSLRNFLTSQERQLEHQARNQLFFEKLLPYAVAFGVEKVWADRFKDMNLAEPTWYHGYYGNSYSTHAFMNSMHSSMTQMSHASTPVQSSTGHSSGFSGGFSGGGGGGGGGGSW